MPCGVFRWTLVYFGVYTDPDVLATKTCRSSATRSMSHTGARFLRTTHLPAVAVPVAVPVKLSALV